MDRKKVEKIFEITGESTSNILAEICIDGAVGSLIPGIVGIRMNYKLNRFQNNVVEMFTLLAGRQNELSRRLSENEQTLKFFKEKVFPLIMDQLDEEVQSHKIKMLAQGVEYIIENELIEENEDLVFSYYDVLHELRIDDIKELLKYTDEYKRHWHEKLQRGEIGLNIVLNKNDTERQKYEEMQGYKTYILNKLEQLGLINTGMDKKIERALNQSGMFFSPREEDRINAEEKEKTELTDFGKNFIRFFKLRFDEVT